MTWSTDIQANILRGLPARRAHYLFVHVDSRQHLRDLVRASLPFTQTASWQHDRFPRGTQGMDQAVLNLAFTRRGLQRATGLTYESDERRRGAIKGMDQDADAFAYRHSLPTSEAAGTVWLDPLARNSMYRRLDLLGEAPIVMAPSLGGNTPTVAHSWSWDPKQLIHVLLWISGPDEASVRSIELPLRKLPGVSVVRAISGLTDPRHIDPFGFADGVNQPAVEGFHGRAEMFGRGALSPEGWRGLKPGEFITGEEDEGGEDTATRTSRSSPQQHLSRLSPDSDVAPSTPKAGRHLRRSNRSSR